MVLHAAPAVPCRCHPDDHRESFLFRGFPLYYRQNCVDLQIVFNKHSGKILLYPRERGTFICIIPEIMRFCLLSSLQIWNSVTGKLVHIYDEHTEQVNCCCFTNSSQNLLLATASNDCLLKVSVNIENYGDTKTHQKISFDFLMYY